MKSTLFTAFLTFFATCFTVVQAEGMRILPPSDKPRLTVTEIDWPTEIGQGSICLWKHDRVAAASITIDDNTAPDHDWWLATAKKYDIKLTWFVITARVDSGNAYFGTWEGFDKILKAGHDVQSHTVDHFNDFKGQVLPTEQNYAQSIADIEKAMPGHHVLTLAYPGGKNAKNDPELARKYFIACRGGAGLFNNAANTNYLSTNSVGGTPPMDADHFSGLPNATTLNPRRPMNYRAWVVMHFHGLTNPKDPPNALKDKVTAMLDYFAADKTLFWFDTFTEVARYGQERDTAKLTVKSEGDKAIRITLTDEMDDTLFASPLTIKLRINPAWKSLSAKQGETDLQVQRIEHDGAVYALVGVVPDRGEALLGSKN